jgi:hypothetical protein
MISRTQRIDEITGEIVYQKDDRMDTMTDEGYRFPHNKNGVVMFGDMDFPRSLSDADVGRITRLCRRYIVGDSNMLGYRKGRKIIAMSPAEIAEYAGYDSRKGEGFVSRMIEHGIIKRTVTDGNEMFFVNPAYYMQRGKRLTMALFLLFQKSLSPLMPAWAIAHFLNQARDLKQRE